MVVGLVLLWPSHRHLSVDPLLKPSRVVNASVTAVEATRCDAQDTAISSAADDCLHATFRLRSGVVTELDIDPRTAQPRVSVGDNVKLSVYDNATGMPVYVLTDFQRNLPLLLMGLLTAAVVIAVARWRGFAALVGVGLTGAGLLGFVLPALLDGRSPVLVALTGAGALLPVLLYLAHGFSARTSSALAGTLLALCLCAGLSVLSVHLTQINGLSNEDAVTLRGFDTRLDITQLLICGFIIGALGALNDVTITQASAVWELSDSGATPRESYRRAMRIGRDHIASSVYTLVFAYAGSALPLLLFVSVLNLPITQVASSNLIAIELVRTMVGTSGLVAAVPLTTAVAALTAPTRSTSATDDVLEPVRQQPPEPEDAGRQLVPPFAWDEP